MTEIIAEISGNHNGKLYDAMLLIEAAKEADCDAVKFQLYKPEDMPADGGDYARYAVPDVWLNELFHHARDLEIELFASIFAPWAIDVLEHHGCMAYKLASPESTRLAPETYAELGDRVFELGKRLLVSSGMRDMRDVSAMSADVLFYCKAGYPATVDTYDAVYLSALRGSQRFTQIGFSDHTVGIMSTLAMMGAGAQVIEKHFKLTEDCVDAAFSINPTEMATLCRIAHR